MVKASALQAASFCPFCPPTASAAESDKSPPQAEPLHIRQSRDYERSSATNSLFPASAGVISRNPFRTNQECTVETLTPELDLGFEGFTIRFEVVLGVADGIFQF